MSDKLNILFIHQNFPGQFKLLANALVANGRHQIVCLGDAQSIRVKQQPSGITIYGYRARKAEQSDVHHYLQSTQNAVRRGQDIVRACQSLTAKGFYPDLVIGHPNWGEMLFLPDVFPKAKIVSLFEFFYQSGGADVAFDPEFKTTADTGFKLGIRHSTQLHALAATDLGISPTPDFGGFECRESRKSLKSVGLGFPGTTLFCSARFF